MRTIRLNSLNTAVELYGKTQYNRQLRKAQPSQNGQSKCLIESLRKAFVRFVSTGKILVAIENIKVLTLRHFRGILRGVALYWEAY